MTAFYYNTSAKRLSEKGKKPYMFRHNSFWYQEIESCGCTIIMCNNNDRGRAVNRLQTLCLIFGIMTITASQTLSSIVSSCAETVVSHSNIKCFVGLDFSLCHDLLSESLITLEQFQAFGLPHGDMPVSFLSFVHRISQLESLSVTGNEIDRSEKPHGIDVISSSQIDC